MGSGRIRELYVDLMDLMINPENYADVDKEAIIGMYDSGTYLGFGIDEEGRFYFSWEDSVQHEYYEQELGESLEDTWARMLYDLKDLS